MLNRIRPSSLANINVFVRPQKGLLGNAVETLTEPLVTNC